jgi:hypothetical protein
LKISIDEYLNISNNRYDKRQTIIFDEEGFLHFFVSGEKNHNLKRNVSNYFDNTFSKNYQNVPKERCFKMVDSDKITIKGKNLSKATKKMYIIEGYFFSRFTKEKEDHTNFQSTSFVGLYQISNSYYRIRAPFNDRQHIFWKNSTGNQNNGDIFGSLNERIQHSNQNPNYNYALSCFYQMCSSLNVDPSILSALELQRNPNSLLKRSLSYFSSNPSQIAVKKLKMKTLIHEINSFNVVKSLYTKLTRCISNDSWTSLRMNCDAQLLSVNRLADYYHYVCFKIKKNLKLVDISIRVESNGFTTIKPIGAFVENLEEALILGLEFFSLLGRIPEPILKEGVWVIEIVCKNHWDSKPSPKGGSETSFSSTLILKSLSQKVKFILPFGLICQDEKEKETSKKQIEFAGNLMKINYVMFNSPFHQKTIKASLTHLLCVDLKSQNNFFEFFDLLIISKDKVIALPKDKNQRENILKMYPKACHLKHNQKNRCCKKCVAIRKCPIHGASGCYNLFSSINNSQQDCLSCSITYASENKILYQMRDDLVKMKVDMPHTTDLLHSKICLGRGECLDICVFNFVLLKDFDAFNKAINAIMQIQPKLGKITARWKDNKEQKHSEKVSIPKSSV